MSKLSQLTPTMKQYYSIKNQFPDMILFFQMGDFFETQMGINLHRDFLDLEYEGKRLHLIHGDGLAKADRGYRFLKRILRNRVNIWLYRKLPPDWAIPLAKKVSGSCEDFIKERQDRFYYILSNGFRNINYARYYR